MLVKNLVNGKLIAISGKNNKGSKNLEEQNYTISHIQ